MIVIYRLVSLVALLALWSGVSLWLGDAVVPGPGETATAAIALLADGELTDALGQTLSVYLAGYALAAVAGVAGGILMGGMPLLGRVVDPYAYALTATPRVAFIPLTIVLLGIGFDAKVAIVFLGASMPILINTYAGVLDGDRDLVEMARSAGAGRFQIFRRILLPGALPFILVGLRLGATIGLINTVVAELYTAVQGLGGLLAIYGNTFRMAHYFVIVLTLAGVGMTVTQLLMYLERRILRWRHVGG